MKLEKRKVVLDFDDTLVNSSEEIIRQLNNEFGMNKTIEDLTDWGYRSIYPYMTNEKVEEMYASQEFFDNIKFNKDALEFLIRFKDEYKFVICSKGSRENLFKKGEFLIQNLKELKNLTEIDIDYEFIGIPHEENGSYLLDKSSIDFSDCLFCIDDNTSSLMSINTPKKILIKNYQEQHWNKTPINENNIYVVNSFKEIIDMCEFDLKLRKEGIFIE